MVGNKTVRVPLGPCRTCVLCQNKRWCRGQDMGPQNTSCFPAAGDPVGGSVDSEIGRIIQVNLIGCRPVTYFKYNYKEAQDPSQCNLSWPLKSLNGPLLCARVHWMSTTSSTKCKCTFAGQPLAVPDGTAASSFEHAPPAMPEGLRSHNEECNRIPNLTT